MAPPDAPVAPTPRARRPVAAAKAAPPHLRPVPLSRRGELWRLGEHRLLCGDARRRAELDLVLAGARVDCVFTSPPYAVGIEYGRYIDDIASLRSTLRAVAPLWSAALVPGGFAVVNFGDVLVGKRMTGGDDVGEYPMALEHYPIFRAYGFTLWSRRVWCKKGAAVGSSRHCINSNRASSNFEHVWTWKTPGKPIIGKQISGEYNSQAGWFQAHGGPLDVPLSEHGAGMPVGVALRCLAIHSRESAAVLEPFCGTGTTLVAAHKLGRRCLALEIEPRYCDIIIRRWRAEARADATLDGTGEAWSDREAAL